MVNSQLSMQEQLTLNRLLGLYLLIFNIMGESSVLPLLVLWYSFISAVLLMR